MLVSNQCVCNEFKSCRVRISFFLPQWAVWILMIPAKLQDNCNIPVGLVCYASYTLKMKFHADGHNDLGIHFRCMDFMEKEVL